MFNIIKLYNCYLTKIHNVYNLKNNKLLKLPYHFKWINLTKINKKFNLVFFKYLFKELISIKRHKKFKKYSFFKYSIMRYRRFLKINQWVKINKFLIKRSKFPIIKTPNIKLLESNVQTNNRFLNNEVKTKNNKTINILNYINYKNLKLTNRINKLNNAGGLHHIFNKNNNVGLFCKKVTLKKKKNNTEFVNEETFNCNKQNITCFTYNNHFYKNNKLNSILNYTIFNTYNQKTVNWRIIN